MTRLSREQLRKALDEDHLDACEPALAWLDAQPASVSAYDLWRSCPEGDWLAWLVFERPVGVEEATLRHIVCDCAELLLPAWEKWAAEHAPEHLKAPRAAIDLGRLGASGEEVSDDAYYAAEDATWAAARAARYARYDVTGAAAAKLAAQSAECAAYWATCAVKRGGRAAFYSALTSGPYAASIVRRRVLWATVRDALAEIAQRTVWANA